MNTKQKDKAILKKTIFFILILFLFFLLAINYYNNAFKIVDSSWFKTWQSDSEELVTSSVTNALTSGFWYNYGLLGEYTNQIGLQGMLFQLVGTWLNWSRVHIGILHVGNVLILCVLLFVYLEWVRREFNFFTALLVYFTLFYNNWLIVSARNLYWVIYTFILPFICLLALLHLEEKKRIQLSCKSLFCVIFITIFIKCACGFEMISTVMISMEIPIIYYAYKNEWSKKQFVRRFGMAGIAAISAFICAVIINLIQQTFYFNSFIKAIEQFLYTVSKRTGLFNIKVAEINQRSLEVSKWSILETYMSDGKPIIGNMHMDELCLLFLIATVLCFIAQKYSLTIDKNRRKLLSLSLALWVSYLGPISWYILASGHSSIHTTINYMLWSLPYLIIGFSLLFTVTLYLASDLWNKYPFVLKAGVLGIIIGCIIYFYLNSCYAGMKYFNMVRNEGVLLSKNTYMDLYYYKQTLFYISDKNFTDAKVFLHIFPVESDRKKLKNTSVTFDNKDFTFDINELKLPFWNHSKLAKVNLNTGYMIHELATGQYTSNETLWEYKCGLIELESPPTTIQPVKLSDRNWQHGIKRDGSVILLEADINHAFLENASVQLVDGQIVPIKGIEFDGRYTHIILEKYIDSVNGFPSTLNVIYGKGV